jgi:hypothetical protein
MPSDDLILNVRQIAGYPDGGPSGPADVVLVQRGGLGGPYYSVDCETLVSTACAAAPMSVGGPLMTGVALPPSAQPGQLSAVHAAFPSEGSINWNAFAANDGTWRFSASGVAMTMTFDPTGGLQWLIGAGAAGAVVPWSGLMQLTPGGLLFLAGQQIATTNYVDVGDAAAQALAADLFAQLQATVEAYRDTSVFSFNMRRGDIFLDIDDILGAGGAPIFSPRFTGAPRAPTPPPFDDSQRVATTAFVLASSQFLIDQSLRARSFVTSFNGRSGAVRLRLADVEHALFSEALPSSPTPPLGDDGTHIATTNWVNQTIASAAEGLLAGYAPLASPAFTGYPSGPTAAPGSSTGQLATTAFVMNAIADSTAGVASFNGRTGLVTLEAADVTGVGGALLVSPVFTGTPQAPTAAAGTSTAQLATCAFVAAAVAASTAGVTSFNTRTGAVALTLADVTGVGGAPLASPNLTGTPLAPTAAVGTNTDQLATTAFVLAQITAIDAGVLSFNGREGEVTLTSADVSAAGGIINPNAALTGVPTAPTAAAGNATTQLATTAFVAAAVAGASGVTSFNTRAGAVTLASADITGAGGLLIAGVTDGSNAAAGQIGEWISSFVASSGAVAGVTGTAFNVTSISLTAGDWDVQGNVFLIALAGAPTVTGVYGWVGLTSAALPPMGASGCAVMALVTPAGAFGNGAGGPTGVLRVSVSATTTVYLSASVNYSGAGASAGCYGVITARRVR